MKASLFFEEFYKFLELKNKVDVEICYHKEIENLQIAFVNELLTKKNLSNV